MNIASAIQNGQVVIRVVIREDGFVSGRLATLLPNTSPTIGVLRFEIICGMFLVPNKPPQTMASFHHSICSLQEFVNEWASVDDSWRSDEQMVAVRYLPHGGKIVLTERNTDLHIVLMLLLTELYRQGTASPDEGLFLEGHLAGTLAERLRGYLNEQRRGSATIR